jgi:hypothetical protein
MYEYGITVGKTSTGTAKTYLNHQTYKISLQWNKMIRGQLKYVRLESRNSDKNI